jgi:hypothetical protein
MPSDEDWDDIEALVSDLEYQLMAGLDPVDGDLIIGNVTPEWSKLAVSIPGANLINILAVANGELRPSWKTASSNPGAAVAVLASDANGYLRVTRLGISSAPLSTVGLALLLDSTNPADEMDALSFVNRLLITTANSKYHYGCLGSVQVRSTSTANVTGQLKGASNSVQVLSTSAISVSNVYGMHGFVTLGAASPATIANARGVLAAGGNYSTVSGVINVFNMIEVDAPVTTGVIHTLRGLKIPDISGADTANYAIETGAGDVKFGGKFACNAATPQASATVNAASTDLPTVIALCNQLRAALVANGICV